MKVGGRDLEKRREGRERGVTCLTEISILRISSRLSQSYKVRLLLLVTPRRCPPKIPSAPNSGLNDFFSLKFLKILTREVPSRIAYLTKSRQYF